VPRGRLRATPGTIAGVLIALAAAGVHAQPPPPAPPSDPAPELQTEVHTIGRLVVTSRVGGHLADPSCREGVTLEPAEIARTLQWVHEEGDRTHRPVLYDTGSLLAPHGVARFAAIRSPDALAALVVALGYQALAFGEAELAGPREALIHTAEALRERGVPMIATNLYCDQERKALCDVLVDAGDGVSMHRIGRDRVAFISLVDPSALERISPDRVQGLRLAPIKESLAQAVRSAHALGATVVIASVDTAVGERPATAMLELAGELPEDGKPDLLLSSAAGDELLFARPPGFRPAVAAAPAGSAARMRLRRNVLAETLDVLVRPAPMADDPHPAVGRFIARVGPQFCEEWGRKLAGGTTKEPLGSQAMLELAAHAARMQTGTELALLPRAILDPSWQPASPSGLTASDVYVAIKRDEPLLVARVEGRWLDQVAKGEASKGLVSPGLLVDDGTVKLHGRPIEARAKYDLVTVRSALVAARALPDGPSWKPAPDATLRSALFNLLERPRDEDPREDLPDVANRPEWTFRTDLRGTFAGTYVNNPSGVAAGSMDDPAPYPDAQLQRPTTANFGWQATIRADAVAKSWGWDNWFESRYRLILAAGQPTNEADDQTFLRSTMRYRGWRERRERFYMPEPFVESYIETEITIPEQVNEDDRDHRHFLIRPTSGLQFTLTQHLNVKALGGFELQAFDPERRVLPGAGAQIVLKPWTMMEMDDRKVTLEGNLDYFVADLGGINRQTLRGTFRAAYQLNAVLGFGWSMELFVAKEKGRAAGISAINSAFIQLGWVGRSINP
jgi:hypothetical protein